MIREGATNNRILRDSFALGDAFMAAMGCDEPDNQKQGPKGPLLQEIHNGV